MGIFELFLAETKPSDEFRRSCASTVRRFAETLRSRLEQGEEVSTTDDSPLHKKVSQGID